VVPAVCNVMWCGNQFNALQDSQELLGHAGPRETGSGFLGTDLVFATTSGARMCSSDNHIRLVAK